MKWRKYTMGTWNAGLFSNDTTCDVKDTYMMLLKKQFNNAEAYEKTLEEYEELIGTDEEPLFWYALADTQWNVGRLLPKVKKLALDYIEQKGGSSLWEENPKKVLKWENTLNILKEKLESPMPPEKIIKKEIEFVKNPWNVGDVYAYQFHTKDAEKHGLLGKYILFQKVGNADYYGIDIYSVVQVFDKVFDAVPTLDVIDKIRILPLANSLDEDGKIADFKNYVPSFDWYMKCTMIYEKKGHYPKKYFSFVGNQCIEDKEYFGNSQSDAYWGKDGMEEWLIEFYINWQNIQY